MSRTYEVQVSSSSFCLLRWCWPGLSAQSHSSDTPKGKSHTWPDNSYQLRSSSSVSITPAELAAYFPPPNCRYEQTIFVALWLFSMAFLCGTHLSALCFPSSVSKEGNLFRCSLLSLSFPPAPVAPLFSQRASPEPTETCLCLNHVHPAPSSLCCTQKRQTSATNFKYRHNHHNITYISVLKAF